jgi:carbon monoxide dehydrogenase subunit G
MELKHSFTVPVPLDRAWDVLLDVERVAPCMPGATLDSVDGDDIAGKIKVKVGPISMTYAGKAHFTERDREAGVVTLEASGKETRGAGTASASVRSELTGEGDQTHVTVLTNLNVTGKPAQFGRGVMNEVGGKLIGIFADNLAKMIAAGDSGSASESASEPAAQPEPAAETLGSGPDVTAAPPADQLGVPIEDLSLPVRAYNSLRREGVHTIGDLIARTPEQLLDIDNIGPAYVEEIRQRLAARGLALSEAPASANGAERPASAFPGRPETAETAEPSQAPPLRTVPAPRPEPSWQPDDEAVDLLSVAGVPVLKRVLPIAAGVVAVAVITFGLRHRRRSRR